MKKIIVFIFLLISCVCFYTCKKDPSLAPIPPKVISPPVPPPAPDTIIYTDISDISLKTTVLTFTAPNSSCSVPNPSGEKFDSVDIDLDGAYDLRFSINSYYYFLSMSSSCINYNCIISVSTINKMNELSIYNENVTYNWINSLLLNDTINNNLRYKSADKYPSILIMHYANYYSSIYSPTTAHNLSGEKYLGLKMLRNGKIMFCWIRIESDGYGIIIKDFAINKTNNNPTLCGQKN